MPNTFDLASSDLREASNTYARVVYTEGHHRVALCKDGIQYLLQRRSDKTRGTEWRSLRYCVTSRALARDWRKITGTAVPDEIATPPNAREATNRPL
jgi:hypothetical protein